MLVALIDLTQIKMDFDFQLGVVRAQQIAAVEAGIDRLVIECVIIIDSDIVNKLCLPHKGADLHTKTVFYLRNLLPVQNALQLIQHQDRLCGNIIDGSFLKISFQL